MPEGPELAIAASYIRRICQGKLFSRVQKSEVTKCIDVPWKDGDKFTLSATSRGKELMICMESIDGSTAEMTKNGKPSSNTPSTKQYVLVRFGMSGRFAFTPMSSMPKHSHLSFITADQLEALNFVDPRRFGNWHVKNSGNEWAPERGPCALTEYQLFRENITKSIDDSVFNRPLCEVMLDQRYFNGIGNYLRAEIIYRAGVPPFDKARDVLQPLIEAKQGNETDESGDTKDLLALCRIVQEEVVALQSTYYTSPDHYLSDNDKAFDEWLKCYGKRTMNQLRDSNNRTMWFSGPAGSMSTKAKKRTDGIIKRKKTTRVKKEVTTVEAEQDTSDQKQSEEASKVVRSKRKRRISVSKTDTMEEEVSTVTSKRKKARINVADIDHSTKQDVGMTSIETGVLTRRRAKLLK